MSEEVFWRMEMAERGWVRSDSPDAAVQATACPRCAAPAGYRCKDAHGWLTHKARVEAWTARQAQA